MRERWRILLFLVLLLVGSSWLLNFLDDDDAPVKKAERHDPDYFMENFTRTGMDKQGKAKNRLMADYLAHYPDDDTTELTKPRLQVFSDKGKPVHVVAERGWVTSGNDVILLYGEVRIWRDNDAGERMLEIITSDLKVLPDDEYAETDNAVTIISGTTITDAVGMRMKMKQQRMELLSEVKTRYEIAPTL